MARPATAGFDRLRTQRTETNRGVGHPNRPFMFKGVIADARDPNQVAAVTGTAADGPNS
jgi:hypothetical protein